MVASIVKDVELYHAWPQVLPGDKAVLFTVGQKSGQSVAVLSLETGERRTLIQPGAFARYVATGHLVYTLEDKLLAAPFDLDQLKVTGSPVVVLKGIANDDHGDAQFSVSESGSLVYVPGGVRGSEQRLVWVDRQGAVEPLAAPPRPYDDPRLSPDGQWVAFQTEELLRDIWIYHIPRQTLNRLTFKPEFPFWPSGD